jgi:hypothetical protein
MTNKNYTPHHLLLFTGIEVMCEGAKTWMLNGKKMELTPTFMITLMEDRAIDWVKPLLRPVQDMTDDEAIHIAKLCLNIKEENFLSALVLRHADNEINVKVDYHDTELFTNESEKDENTISKDVVTIPSDFCIHHSEYLFAPENQPQIFQYLIQQQFDEMPI